MILKDAEPHGYSRIAYNDLIMTELQHFIIQILQERMIKNTEYRS